MTRLKSRGFININKAMTFEKLQMIRSSIIGEGFKNIDSNKYVIQDYGHFIKIFNGKINLIKRKSVRFNNLKIEHNKTKNKFAINIKSLVGKKKTPLIAFETSKGELKLFEEAQKIIKDHPRATVYLSMHVGTEKGHDIYRGLLSFKNRSKPRVA